ncbi:MAG: Rrf2 family transcriptional regulator, partial [Erysipelotrichaceae bacterium]|nr:Rrf2 family transcriptional regulator [Erysipelotrichaceae bacterium]
NKNDKEVLKISVPKSYGGIVATVSGKVLYRRLKADGTPENVPMYPSQYATRLSDLRLLDYSALPIAEATIDDFDILEVQRLKNMVESYKGDKSLLELTDEDLYKALGLVREQNSKLIPTVTGLLLIGKVGSIKRFIPTMKTSFQVLEGTEVRVNDDLEGSVLASIDRINTYLTVWNPENEIEMGMFRVPDPDFDRRAIREAVINAFSHRDYTKMGRVRIAINDEGLTVANPGGFIEGVSIDNLLTAEPHGRNPQLTDALKRIGLAEKTGRGIDRIYEGSLLYGKPLPDYSLSNSVTVTLFIARGNTDVQFATMIANEQMRLGRPLSINSLLVLNVLREKSATVKQLAEVTKLSTTMVNRILDTLSGCGIVESKEKGRGISYSLSEKLYNGSKGKKSYVEKVEISDEELLTEILKMAKRSDYIARMDVIHFLNVKEDKAYKLLKVLVEDNRLEPVNKGKYSKYKYIE